MAKVRKKRRRRSGSVYDSSEMMKNEKDDFISDSDYLKKKCRYFVVYIIYL